MRYLLHQNYLLYHTFDDTAVNPRSRAFVSFGPGRKCSRPMMSMTTEEPSVAKQPWCETYKQNVADHLHSLNQSQVLPLRFTDFTALHPPPCLSTTRWSGQSQRPRVTLSPLLLQPRGYIHSRGNAGISGEQWPRSQLHIPWLNLPIPAKAPPL